jgi:hypothetical protein
VRFSVNNFQHTLLLAFNRATVTLPPFATTLPAESLGFTPDFDDPNAAPVCQCYGVPTVCSPSP